MNECILTGSRTDFLPSRGKMFSGKDQALDLSSCEKLACILTMTDKIKTSHRYQQFDLAITTTSKTEYMCGDHT